MAFIEEELRRGAVQAEVVSYDEQEETPYIQLYVISGAQVRTATLFRHTSCHRHKYPILSSFLFPGDLPQS